MVVSTGAFAQAKDQKTALNEIEEGSTFKAFWGIKTTNGSAAGQARKTIYELQFEKDIPGFTSPASFKPADSLFYYLFRFHGKSPHSTFT
jgi:hypothetical protein